MTRRRRANPTHGRIAMAKNSTSTATGSASPRPTRPLNHYQLLRLKQFEDDTAKIRDHYRKMNAHVRKFATRRVRPAVAGAAQRAGQGDALPDRRAAEGRVRRRRWGRKDGRHGPPPHASRRSCWPTRRSTRRNWTRPATSPRPSAWRSATRSLQQKLATPDVVMQAYAESIGPALPRPGRRADRRELIAAAARRRWPGSTPACR